jgi:hypothetical protein
MATVRYVAPARTTQKTSLPTLIPLLRITEQLHRNGYFTGFTILALSKYATVFFIIIVA